MQPRTRPAIHLELERHAGCTVVRCVGRVILEHGVATLEDVAIRELSAGQRVILDLTDVTQVDASGIGAIARLCRSGLITRQPVVIIGADARVHRLLELTQLDTIADIGDAEYAPPPAAGYLCGTC